MTDKKVDAEIVITADEQEALNSLKRVEAALKHVGVTAEEAGKETKDAFDLKAWDKGVAGIGRMQKALGKLGTSGRSAANSTKKAWGQTFTAWNQGLSIIEKVTNAIGKVTEVVEDQGKKITQMNILGQHSKWNQFKDDLLGIAEATNNAVHSFDLLDGVNKALAYKMDLSGGKLKEMAKISQTVAAQMGLEFKDAFDRLVRGTGKRELELLDELGIAVKKQSELEEVYAASLGKTLKQLTAAEKQMAFTEGVLIKLRESTGLIDLDSALSNITQASNHIRMKATEAQVALGQIAEKGAKYVNKVFEDSYDERFEKYLKTQTNWEAERQHLILQGKEYEISVDKAVYEEKFKLHEAELRTKLEGEIEKRKWIVRERQSIVDLYDTKGVLETQFNVIAQANFKKKVEQEKAHLDLIAANIKMARGQLTGDKKVIAEAQKRIDDAELTIELAERATETSLRSFRIQNKLRDFTSVKELKAYKQQIDTFGLSEKQLGVIENIYQKQLQMNKLTDKTFKAPTISKRDAGATEEWFKYLEDDAEGAAFRISSLLEDAFSDTLRQENTEDWFNGATDRFYDFLQGKQELLIEANAEQEQENLRNAKRQAQIQQLASSASISLINATVDAIIEADARGFAQSIAQTFAATGQQIVAHGVKTVFASESELAVTGGIFGGVGLAAGQREILGGAAMMLAGGAASNVLAPSSGSGGSATGSAADKNEIATATQDIKVNVTSNLFGSRTEAKVVVNDLMR